MDRKKISSLPNEHKYSLRDLGVGTYLLDISITRGLLIKYIWQNRYGEYL